TPRFYSAAAKSGDVLTLVNQADGVAVADYYTPTNIYNGNGILTGNRTVSGANNTILWDWFSSDEHRSQYIILAATNEIRLVPPSVRNATAAVNQVWTLLNAANGAGEWRNAATGGGPTIYSGDGTVQAVDINGIRNVYLGAATNRLVFQGGGGAS